MKLQQVFDDLGDFVAAYRGAISREGMRADLAERHVPGTVLDIEIDLADGLHLVRGQAGVVDVGPAPAGSAARWRTVMRFVELSSDSLEFLGRLEQRQSAEGQRIFLPPGLSPSAMSGGDLANSEALPAATPAIERGADPGTGSSEEEDVGSMVAAALQPASSRERAEPIEARARLVHGERRPLRTAALVGLWIVGLSAIFVIAIFAARMMLPEVFGGGRASEGAVAATVDVAISPSPADRRPEDPVAAATPILTEPPVQEPSAGPPPTSTSPPRQPSPTLTPPSPATANGVHVLAMDWRLEGDATVVELVFDRMVRPESISHFRMTNAPGPREVVVVRGVAASDAPLKTLIDSPLLTSVRTWLHEDRSPPELHVVLDLLDGNPVFAEPIVDGAQVRMRVIPGSQP